MTAEPNTITFHNINADWVMRITADRRIEVNEDVEVTETAQKVLDAMQYLLKAQPKQRKPPEWYAQWIRNNYQDYWNIATLCEEMTKAAHGIKE